MEHFERNMGCIEILGKSKRIERVYFEVKESRLKQWDEPQIQESRRNFLHSVEMGSQKRKLQGFVSFCEDTIFEVSLVQLECCALRLHGDGWRVEWGGERDFMAVRKHSHAQNISIILNLILRKLRRITTFIEGIFFHCQINHTDTISGSEQMAMETRAVQHRKRHNRMIELPPQ